MSTCKWLDTKHIASNINLLILCKMKKIILAIFSIALFSIACNKAKTTLEPSATKSIKTRKLEDNIPFNGHTYRIINGMLEFTSIEEYENLFGTETTDVSPESLQSFANLVKASSAMQTYWEYHNFPADSIQYSFIGNIVNHNGVIRIDDYLILLDFDHNKAFMTITNSELGLLQAVSGDIATDIEVHGMEEDLIDIIIYAKKGIFCKERYATKKHDGLGMLTLSQTLLPPPNNVYVNNSLNSEVRYGVYAIYYELFSKVVVTPVPYATEYYTFVTSYSWERRCSSKTGGWTYTDDFTASPTDTEKRTCYSNLRALKHYSINQTCTSPSAPGSSITVNIAD